MAPIKQLFMENQVFGRLPEKTLDMLIQRASVHRYQKGEVIVHAGEIWRYLFLITEGSVQAVKLSNEGRNLVVTTFARGDIFWGIAFFYADMPMPVSLEAYESTLIYLWQDELLHPIFKREGEACWELTRLMIQKMTRASEILEEIAFQPVAGRLAKLLLETGQGNPTAPIARSLTLDEMAARIGSTREMVCRFLHRFQDEGLIDITRTDFRITDPLGLQTLTQKAKG